MQFKIRRRMFYGAIGLCTVAAIAIIGIKLYQKHQDKIVADILQEYAVMEDIVNTSTANWDNTIWLSDVDRDVVKKIKFVNHYDGQGQKVWLFDGIACYLNNGTVYVVVGDYIKLTGSMNGAFAGLNNLESIEGLELLDTSNVKDMSYMFQKCTSLKSISCIDIETNSALSTKGMFLDCENLTTLDLSTCDMSLVEDMSKMFAGCKGLESIRLPKTQNVKNLSEFLLETGVSKESGTEIKGSLNTANCENMSCFAKDSNIQNINFVENFNTESLKDASYAFSSCSPMSIDLSNWNMKNVENLNGMFMNCSILKDCNVSGWDMPNLKQCEMMFFYCSSLESIKIDWTNLPQIGTMRKMFQRCFSLKEVDFSAFDNQHVGDARELFKECEVLRVVKVKNFNADASDYMFESSYGFFNSPDEAPSDTFYDINFGKKYNCFDEGEMG